MHLPNIIDGEPMYGELGKDLSWWFCLGSLGINDIKFTQKLVDHF